MMIATLLMTLLAVAKPVSCSPLGMLDQMLDYLDARLHEVASAGGDASWEAQEPGFVGGSLPRSAHLRGLLQSTQINGVTRTSLIVHLMCSHVVFTMHASGRNALLHFQGRR